MKSIKIYASGAECKAPESFGSWREILKKDTTCCVSDIIHILDPMEHFNYDDKAPTTSKQCHDYFMWLIDQSDILLVNLDHSDVSVGTGCEVQHAFDSKKPIIGFGADKSTWYSWTTDLCDVIFETMEDAIEYIVEHYCGII